jgi:hypothetical protein
VTVTGRVVSAGGGDAVASQLLGDGVETPPCDVGSEDPLDHGGSDRIDLEPVEPLTIRRLARVGVRSRVGQPVAVGRPTAEEPTLM